MAKIQIDFDQVMRFGDLHGDIGRSLHSHRAAFRHDSARLDQIIDEFGLQRTTSNPHFQGLTVAAAMGDADAHAGRVADSLIKTSSRIFNHAGSFRDDRFNWAGAAFGAVGVALVGPFGTALLSSMGGELAGAASAGLVFGRTVSPALGHLLPVFSGIVGVLDIVDGFSGLMDPYRDGWSTVSSGLKIAAGGIGVVVGVIGVGLIVGLGSGAAAFFVVAAAPFLIAGAVLSLGALLIDERETVGRIVSAAGRAASGAVRAAATTTTEAVHDLLAVGDRLWDRAAVLPQAASHLALRAEMSVTEEIQSRLDAVADEWTHLVASPERMPDWLNEKREAVFKWADVAVVATSLSLKQRPTWLVSSADWSAIRLARASVHKSLLELAGRSVPQSLYGRIGGYTKAVNAESLMKHPSLGKLSGPGLTALVSGVDVYLNQRRYGWSDAKTVSSEVDGVLSVGIGIAAGPIGGLAYGVTRFVSEPIIEYADDRLDISGQVANDYAQRAYHVSTLEELTPEQLAELNARYEGLNGLWNSSSDLVIADIRGRGNAVKNALKAFQEVF